MVRYSQAQALNLQSTPSLSNSIIPASNRHFAAAKGQSFPHLSPEQKQRCGERSMEALHHKHGKEQQEPADDATSEVGS